MFFFQDDIGLLIQLQKIPFFQYLLTPQSEHFVPILHIIYSLEYRSFHLNFVYYFAVSIILHLINVCILSFITYKLTRKTWFAILAILIFIINITYTEPLLWLSAQGVVLSTIFIGLSFYTWLRFIFEKNNTKYLIFTLLLNLCAGFSFGLGVGVSIVFGLATYIYKNKLNKDVFLKSELLFLITGLLSYFIGPFIAPDSIGRVTPIISDPIKDVFSYFAFVLAGVARGVIGRFFLPGYEPRHFEILPTIISFIPFIILVCLLVNLFKKNIKDKLLLIVIIPFIFYPYIWAGFLRFQFGLKQSLAERYAYPSIFFFTLILIFTIRNISFLKNFKKLKILTLTIILLIFFQARSFYIRTLAFEDKPLSTKEYFNQLKIVLNESEKILNLPLPSYINQEYKISDIAPLISQKTPNREFIELKGNYCLDIKEELKKETVTSFYKEQAEDPFIDRFFGMNDYIRCLTLFKKAI